MQNQPPSGMTGHEVDPQENSELNERKNKFKKRSEQFRQPIDSSVTMVNKLMVYIDSTLSNLRKYEQRLESVSNRQIAKIKTDSVEFIIYWTMGGNFVASPTEPNSGRTSFTISNENEINRLCSRLRNVLLSDLHEVVSQDLRLSFQHIWRSVNEIDGAMLFDGAMERIRHYIVLLPFEKITGIIRSLDPVLLQKLSESEQSTRLAKLFVTQDYSSNQFQYSINLSIPRNPNLFYLATVDKTNQQVLEHTVRGAIVKNPDDLIINQTFLLAIEECISIPKNLSELPEKIKTWLDSLIPDSTLSMIIENIEHANLANNHVWQNLVSQVVSLCKPHETDPTENVSKLLQKILHKIIDSHQTIINLGHEKKSLIRLGLHQFVSMLENTDFVNLIQQRANRIQTTELSDQEGINDSLETATREAYQLSEVVTDLTNQIQRLNVGGKELNEMQQAKLNALMQTLSGVLMNITRLIE